MNDEPHWIAILDRSKSLGIRSHRHHGCKRITVFRVISSLSNHRATVNSYCTGPHTAPLVFYCTTPLVLYYTTPMVPSHHSHDPDIQSHQDSGSSSSTSAIGDATVFGVLDLKVARGLNLLLLPSEDSELRIAYFRSL